MANLKDIRTRISSTESTKQITSAMKLVSAAKLRKAQNNIIKMRPYSGKLNQIMKDLSSDASLIKDNPFTKQISAEKSLIIPITSNRGLCGAFNSNVLKKTAIVQSEVENADYFTIGRKASEHFNKRTKFNVIESIDDVWDNISWDYVSEIADKIIELYKSEKYSKVILVYNQFKSAATQFVISESFLPLQTEVEGDDIKEKEEIEYILEPSKELIMSELIPKSLKTQFYKAILESNAAEHAARMTAMHQATDNATELIKDLKLSYNKARQAAITNEIIEIVSGANAL
jgi:F-type H+-transporting ATPase subunit gamma